MPDIAFRPGAILLMPTKPPGELEGYIESTYGNFDQRRVQAALNVPLADIFVRVHHDRNIPICGRTDSPVGRKKRIPDYG